MPIGRRGASLARANCVWIIAALALLRFVVRCYSLLAFVDSSMFAYLRVFARWVSSYWPSGMRLRATGIERVFGCRVSIRIPMISGISAGHRAIAIPPSKRKARMGFRLISDPRRRILSPTSDHIALCSLHGGLQPGRVLLRSVSLSRRFFEALLFTALFAIRLPLSKHGPCHRARIFGRRMMNPLSFFAFRCGVAVLVSVEKEGGPTIAVGCPSSLSIW